VGKLYDTIKKMALKGKDADFNSVIQEAMEVHKEIGPLADMYGKDTMWMWNFRVAQVIASAFRMHYSSMMPGVNLFAEIFHGRKQSVPMMRQWGLDHDAFQMSSDGIRRYIQLLAKDGKIAETGRYSAPALMALLSVDDQTFMLLEAGPRWAMMGTVGMLWKTITSAWEKEMANMK